MTKEFFQLTKLAVCQGIHRIDDDGLNPFSAPVSDDMIDYGDNVGETLSRSSSSGQDVIVSTSGNADGFGLVPIEMNR